MSLEIELPEVYGVFDQGWRQLGCGFITGGCEDN